MKKLTQSLTSTEVTSVAVALEELTARANVNVDIQKTLQRIQTLLVHCNHEQMHAELSALYESLLENNAAEHELEAVADLINEMSGEQRTTLAEAIDMLEGDMTNTASQYRVNRAIENNVSTHLGA